MYLKRSTSYLKCLHIILLICITTLCSSWGFFAHRKINRHAVFSLPTEMMHFYKSNIDFVTTHAVDPDKRRYVDPLEGPRHFLDVDRYGNKPFEQLPKKWKDAVAKHTEATLRDNGIVPWHIEKTYYSLVKAFQARDSLRILRLSADLGHYISDAHVPLHTTENYNGQLSDQDGIHGLWESRLPELFADSYNYLLGKARYVEDPLKEAWHIVEKTFQFKDSVLLIEERLNKQFPASQKCSFAKRKGRLVRNYSANYCKAYHLALGGMVERQMRASILSVASFWFSAWVDAGQPDLNGLAIAQLSAKEYVDEKHHEHAFQNGQIIGREESH